MTTVDIIIVIVALGSAFMGWKKGVVVLLGGLAAIIGGIVACRLWGDDFAVWLTARLSDGTEGVADAGGYLYGVLARLLLFIAAYLVIKVVANFLRGVTRALHVGVLDRGAGLLLCMFEWLLFLSLVLNVWLLIKPHTQVSHMGRLFNGKAAVAVMNLGPDVLGWAVNACPDFSSEGEDKCDDAAHKPNTASKR